MNKARISFLFPYRWLVEDREYLGNNLVCRIIDIIGNENIVDLENISLYKVIVSYHAYKPVKAKLTKTEVQKMLKPLFKYGRCANVEILFHQNRSKTMLPVFDFQIYF